MSSKHFHQIIRKAVRFQNAVEAAEAKALEGADFDAGFDGGEFSGPAHERKLAAEADRIAQRLGFGDAALANSIVKFLGCSLRKPAHIYYDPTLAAPLPASL